MSTANSRPFTIYSEARPRRVAFLVDPEDCPPEQFDAILEANYRLWGGRYNPIIPVSRGVIEESYWQLLTFVDPDIIYTYVELPPDLIGRIDRAISPYYIRSHHPTTLGDGRPHYPPRLTHEQAQSIHLLPLIADQPLRLGRSKSLISRTTWGWPYRRFVLRNFGILEDVLWPRPRPRELPAVIIDDTATDMSVLELLANDESIILPFLLSEHEARFPEPERSNEPAYAVLLGDGFWLWLRFWNRVFLLGGHGRSRWNTLWLPTERLEDERFIRAANQFLGSRVYRDGNYPATLRVVSSGIEQSRVTELAPVLFEHVDALVEYGNLVPGNFPPIARSPHTYGAFEQPFGGLWRKRGVVQQQGAGTRVLLQVPAPPFGNVDGKRVIDLKIEYRPERFFYTNQRFWWQLPKSTGITHYFAPETAGRVGMAGLMSVEVDDEENLELGIPDDSTVLWHVLIGQRGPRYTDDLRYPAGPGPFSDFLQSDKGTYARGVLGLFGTVHHAGMFFENNYWCGLAEFFTRQDPIAEAPVLERIVNWLKKDRTNLLESLRRAADRDYQWIARRVTTLGRQRRVKDNGVPFAFLLDRLVKERTRFVQAEKREGFDNSESLARQDLTEALQTLVASKVFLQGFQPRCSYCGSVFWYSPEEVSDGLVCKGCITRFNLPPEAPWFYRLNALILNAVAFHGTSAVVSMLSQILRIARTSFLFDVGVLLSDRKSGKEVEIDIVCVCDGELTIVEVKNSADEFSSADLEKLAVLTRLLQPQVVALGAFHGTGETMARHEQELVRFLGGMEVRTRVILPAQYSFQPAFHV